MNKNIDKNGIEAACNWLKDQIAKVNYGEVSLSFTLHSGQIRKAEQKITTNVKIDPKGSNS
jgi:hypothetical protein